MQGLGGEKTQNLFDVDLAKPGQNGPEMGKRSLNAA